MIIRRVDVDHFICQLIVDKSSNSCSSISIYTVQSIQSFYIHVYNIILLFHVPSIV